MASGSSRSGPMQVYVSNVNPILDGNDPRYLLTELANLQDVLKSTQAMIPQADTLEKVRALKVALLQ